MREKESFEDDRDFGPPGWRERAQAMFSIVDEKRRRDAARPARHGSVVRRQPQKRR